MAITAYSRKILEDVKQMLQHGHKEDVIVAALKRRGLSSEESHTYVAVARARHQEVRAGHDPRLHYGEKSRGFLGFLKKAGLR